MFAWWDYGYPIRYYAHVKNHSDGGKHDGATNFIESFILCSTNQRAAANLMRESVEGYEELIKKGLDGKTGTLEYLLAKRGVDISDYESYLKAVGLSSFKPLAKTREVYLYLPYEMGEIFPTIKLFSNLDLLTGQQKSEPYFGTFNDYIEDDKSINLDGTIIDKKSMTIKIDSNTVLLNSFDLVYYDRNGKLVTKHQDINDGGDIHLISMPSMHTYILADDEMYNSVYIQMYVFEHYDKTLFELVSSTPQAKIYRLKI